jgi:hypothetical protein
LYDIEASGADRPISTENFFASAGLASAAQGIAENSKVAELIPLLFKACQPYPDADACLLG